MVRDEIGASASFIADVSLQLSIDPVEIESGGTEALLLILGSVPGTLHTIEFVGEDGQSVEEVVRILRQERASDRPGHGNPAEATLSAYRIFEELTFRVRASHEDTFGSSGLVLVTAAQSEVDGGCGCSPAAGDAGGATRWLAAMFLLAALRHRRPARQRTI